MYFKVLNVGEQPPPDVRDQAFLITDDWNDWHKYTTQYALVVADAKGKAHPIGDVKIGQFGMREGQKRPDLPDTFDKLNQHFFSLGQDDTYYERLKNLG